MAHHYGNASPSGFRPWPSTSQTSGSINSTDSENTKIRKDVVRLYERAAFGTYNLDEIRARPRGPGFGDILESEATLVNVPLTQDEERNITIVAWDGDDGPFNPLNWPTWKKSLNILSIFMMCAVSPLASSVFAPATQALMEDFKTLDPYLSAFVVSVYILGYAFGLLLISPLSELYGRVPLYHICNLIFVGANCWCAVTKDMSRLAAARFVAGCGGSSVFALAPSSVADMLIKEKRGAVLALLGVAYNVGPAVSPIVGSRVNDRWGWRWIFWMVALMGALNTVTAWVSLSETYEPVLLRRKTSRLRKLTGNSNLRSRLDNSSVKSPYRVVFSAMLLPLNLLLSPPVLATSFLGAVGYGFLFILYTMFPQTFVFIYSWRPKNIGLAYLGNAVGNLLGMIAGGGISDAIVKSRARKGDVKPENRLLPMIFCWPLCGIGLLVYAWTVQKAAHWIWPMVGTAMYGAGTMTTILFCGAYIIDAYTTHSASGMAASTVLRSLLGGLVPLFSNKLYKNLDAGWGFTMLGLIALVLSPVPWLIYRYGERMRASFDPSIITTR